MLIKATRIGSKGGCFISCSEEKGWRLGEWQRSRDGCIQTIEFGNPSYIHKFRTCLHRLYLRDDIASLENFHYKCHIAIGQDKDNIKRNIPSCCTTYADDLQNFPLCAGRSLKLRTALCIIQR
jgi:hypothetical protein